MSGESSALRSDGDHGQQSITLASVLPFVRDRRAVVAGIGAIATLFVALQTVVSILYNLPFDPVHIPTAIRSGVAVGTAIVLGLALVVVALLAREATIRVGLLFAGVFGLLVVVSPAATAPAVVALGGGSTLALLGSLGPPESYQDARQIAVAVAFLVGITASITSMTGILDSGFREIGAMATLLALFGLGIRAETDRTALIVGTVAALGLIAASMNSPFALGSALLVTFGIVGVPHLLVALALSGATAAIVAGLRRREWSLVVGTTLLLFAGVPVTLPGALAVLLGATLILFGFEVNGHIASNTEVTA